MVHNALAFVFCQKHRATYSYDKHHLNEIRMLMHLQILHHLPCETLDSPSPISAMIS